MSIEQAIIAQLRPVLKDELRSARRALDHAKQVLGHRRVRKDSSRPFLSHITDAEEHYRDQLVEALRFGLASRNVASAWSKKTRPVTKDDGDADDLDTEADSFVDDLTFDPYKLMAAVTALYGAGYLIGSKEAVKLLRAIGVPLILSELGLRADALVWSKWTPGDAAAATELAGIDGGSGLQSLLDGANVIIGSIQSSRLGELADVLAAGARAGDSVDELSARIEALLDDPTRADMIANTELNRAVTASTLDTYRENGIEQFDVLVFNPCPVCEDEEAGNPHGLDEEAPPYHPTCRCAASPHLGSNQAGDEL